MHTKGPVIPLTHIKTAVALLVAGLIHHETLDHHQWDDAVTTLARSHQQLGGTTRQLLYATFAAANPRNHPDDLPRTLTALADALDIPTTIERADSRESHLPIATQLPLFTRP